jgi:hypothetical protein
MTVMAGSGACAVVATAGAELLGSGVPGPGDADGAPAVTVTVTVTVTVGLGLIVGLGVEEWPVVGRGGLGDVVPSDGRGPRVTTVPGLPELGCRIRKIDRKANNTVATPLTSVAVTVDPCAAIHVMDARRMPDLGGGSGGAWMLCPI